MENNQFEAVEKALGVEPESIAEMPEEIRAKMKTVLETIVVRTDEDRKELYNALDDAYKHKQNKEQIKEMLEATLKNFIYKEINRNHVIVPVFMEV